MQNKGQLSLFSTKEDYEKVFDDGDIVFQTWAWVGSFDTIFPFWQVRCSEIIEGVREYYCIPVPYGVFTCDGNWFTKKDIEKTGLSWRVPDDDEIDEWCKKHPFDVTTPNRYLRNLNSMRHNENGWYHQLFLPFPEEKELVELLKSTGIDYENVTRDNFNEAMKELIE